MTISGRYYDGRTSQSHELQLTLDSAGVLQPMPALFEPISLKSIKVSSRIGNTPRILSFPDGATFETDDNEEVDLWQRLHTRHSNWLHTLENKLSYVLGALFLTATLLVAGALWGVPWLSNVLAHALPSEVSAKLGEGALESMDRFFFDESELSEERRRELTSLFQKLLPEDKSDFDYKLNFRKGGFVGPNAFALPNGNVVMTDELVGLAESDDEIASVLLHEIGHVVYRHSLRQAIGHSGLAILTMAIIGDVNAAGAIIVALPGVLFQSSYAREMEWEADGYSLERMQRLHIDPENFANFMERLEAYVPPAPVDDELRDEQQSDSALAEHSTEGGQQDSEQEAEESVAGACSPKQDGELDDEPEWFNYLSTHPSTAERIARFRQVQALD